jgi:hypothetical protein
MGRRSAYLSGAVAPAAAAAPSIRARAAPPSSTLGLPKRAVVASPSAAARKPKLACLAATATFLDSIRDEAALGRDQLDAELLRLHLPSHSLVASCGGGRRDLAPPAPSASLRPPTDANVICSLSVGEGSIPRRLQNTVNLPSNFALHCWTQSYTCLTLPFACSFWAALGFQLPAGQRAQQLHLLPDPTACRPSTTTP